MKLIDLKEAFNINDKYSVKSIDNDSTHSPSIKVLNKKDANKDRKFYLKGYEYLDLDIPEYEQDNLNTYEFGKISGFIEYTAFKIYKYLGLKIPKSVNIHYDIKKDSHQLLVSAFNKQADSYDDKYEKFFVNNVRSQNLFYALFVGNTDFHIGNSAMKIKGNKLVDYYMYDLEMACRSIPDNIEMFDYYLRLADKIVGPTRKKQMDVIKSIELKDINYIVDISKQHALAVVKKSFPMSNKFRNREIKKWDVLLAEVSKKIKGNLKKNKKYLLERYK